MKLDVSTKDGYLIAAGLRGSDVGTGYTSTDFSIGSSLKKLFSARLRTMCQVNYIGATMRSSKHTTFDIEAYE